MLKWKIKKGKSYKLGKVGRPKKLSEDKTTTYDTVKHLLNFLVKKNKINFDYIILLQPTSPIRNEKDIFKALNIINKNKKIQSIVSTNKTLESLGDLVYKNKNDYNSPSKIIKNFHKKNKNNFLQ